MQKRLLSLALLAIAIQPVNADVSLSFIEYRVLGQLGQIRLSTGFVHDPSLQARIVAQRDAFERRGIILIHVEAERRFVRDERLAGHAVRTEVLLYPPMGRGLRGGRSSATVVITVDGKKKVDCPYDRGPLELSDLSLLLLDGFISVQGSRDGKGFRALSRLSSDDVITSAWLAANAFDDENIARPNTRMHPTAAGH